jgi:transcription elongation factor SPT4
MARKGVATVKAVSREDKYISTDSNSDDFTSTGSPSDTSNTTNENTPVEKQYLAQGVENVDPAASRARLNLSKAPKSGPLQRQPRQASGTRTTEQNILANALFPDDFSSQVLPSIEHPEPPASFSAYLPQRQTQQPLQETRPPNQNSAAPRSRATGQGRASASAHANLTASTHNSNLTPIGRRSSGQKPLNDDNGEMPDNMIQGGAYIPPGQQRNMRACMVCSVVRTQQQFLSQGCPNCEDILELTGNPEQINDCTSQVFEGLITVADTSRSWVARYQRLDGYKAGVYATQVEGILPDDIIGLVESAGINYVPRDGSEQEMLPKD